MVIFIDVDVNKIAYLGRDFPWRKPASCPKCNAGLWWHGFVLVYFDHLSSAVFLRRLRCPRCGAVHRLRPRAYWSRFRSSIKEIKQTINRFLNQGRHLQSPGSRQLLWWRRFCDNCRLMIGLNWELYPYAFDLLISWGQIPVSSSV